MNGVSSNPMGTEVKQSTLSMMLYEFFCVSVQTSDGKTFSWGRESIKAIKQMIKNGYLQNERYVSSVVMLTEVFK